MTTLVDKDYNILESNEIDMRDNVHGKFSTYDCLGYCYGICDGLLSICRMLNKI